MRKRKILPLLPNEGMMPRIPRRICAIIRCFSLSLFPFPRISGTFLNMIMNMQNRHHANVGVRPSEVRDREGGSASERVTAEEEKEVREGLLLRRPPPPPPPPPLRPT